MRRYVEILLRNSGLDLHLHHVSVTFQNRNIRHEICFVEFLKLPLDTSITAKRTLSRFYMVMYYKNRSSRIDVPSSLTGPATNRNSSVELRGCLDSASLKWAG